MSTLFLFPMNLIGKLWCEWILLHQYSLSVAKLRRTWSAIWPHLEVFAWNMLTFYAIIFSSLRWISSELFDNNAKHLACKARIFEKKGRVGKFACKCESLASQARNKADQWTKILQNRMLLDRLSHKRAFFSQHMSDCEVGGLIEKSTFWYITFALKLWLWVIHKSS